MVEQAMVSISVLFVLVSILTVCIVWCMIRLSKIEEVNRKIMYYRYIRSSMDNSNSSNMEKVYLDTLIRENSNKNTGMMWSYSSIEKNNPYYTGIVDIDEDNSNSN